jgi:hypothetical protein
MKGGFDCDVWWKITTPAVELKIAVRRDWNDSRPAW